MQYGYLSGIDKPISRLVQGTVMVNSRDIEKSFALLDEGYELGCTAFDTAHVYGRGDNERTVGRWVNERGIWDSVVIIGKGAHHNQDRKRVTPFDITADIHDSLARFGFDMVPGVVDHRRPSGAAMATRREPLRSRVASPICAAFGSGASDFRSAISRALLTATNDSSRSVPARSSARKAVIPATWCATVRM